MNARFSALAALLLAPVAAQAQTVVTPSSASGYTEGLCIALCTVVAPTNAVDGDPSTRSRVNIGLGIAGGAGVTASYGTALPATAVAYFDVAATELSLAQVASGARIDLLSGGTVVSSGAYGGALVGVLNPGTQQVRLSYGGGVAFDAARLVYSGLAVVLGSIDVAEAAADPTGSLPVELVSFTAQRDGDAAVLRWETAAETDNAGFAVELRRGASGDAWQEIAFVAGRGTTSEAHRYDHRVAGLAPGRHAFRLRQVDLDGTATVSAAVEVVVTGEASWTLHAPSPNPSRGMSRVALDVAQGGPVDVSLVDPLGRRVAVLFEGTAGAGERLDLAIDTAPLAAGVYRVVARGARAAETRPLVVVR